jgi:hypothetical protein
MEDVIVGRASRTCDGDEEMVIRGGLSGICIKSRSHSREK